MFKKYHHHRPQDHQDQQAHRVRCVAPSGWMWMYPNRVWVGCALAFMWSTASAQVSTQCAMNAPSAPSTSAASNTVEAHPPLTLEQAVHKALQDHPDLAVAQREVEAAQAQVLQGQTSPNPELAYSLEDLQTPTRTQSVQLNWPVELGGKRAARVSAAQRGSEVALEDLMLRRSEVRAAVVTAFFDALMAQEHVVLLQDSVTLAQRATDAAVKRVGAGKVSPLEETRARVAEAQVRLEWTQALSEQRNAVTRLSSLLGPCAPRWTQLDGQAQTLAGVPSWPDMERRLEASPALRRARQEVQWRSALVEVERSKRTPDVTLSLGMKRANDVGRNQVLLGLSVPLPFFDRNQGPLLEALKREDKARDEMLALQWRLDAQALQVRERLQSWRAQAEVLQQEVLSGAQKAYEAITLGFEHGKFNFLEVLDAQRTYFAAKSQYFTALSEAHRAAAEMDKLLGE